MKNNVTLYNLSQSSIDLKIFKNIQRCIGDNYNEHDIISLLTILPHTDSDTVIQICAVLPGSWVLLTKIAFAIGDEVVYKYESIHVTSKRLRHMLLDAKRCWDRETSVEDLIYLRSEVIDKYFNEMSTDKDDLSLIISIYYITLIIELIIKGIEGSRIDYLRKICVKMTSYIKYLFISEEKLQKIITQVIQRYYLS